MDAGYYVTCNVHIYSFTYGTVPVWLFVYIIIIITCYITTLLWKLSSQLLMWCRINACFIENCYYVVYCVWTFKLL